MKLKLFFSHAWNDKQGSAIKKLLLLLQKEYEVWLDKKQIDIGDHIDDTVAKGIEACDIFVIIWSKQAHESKGVSFEIEAAAKMQKPILILMIEKFDIAHSQWLNGREYIDFSGDDAQFQISEINLQNFLLRKSLAKMQASQNQHIQHETADLTAQTNAVQDVLYELEDINKRQILKASGNDHSDIYIQSTMNAFDKTLHGEAAETKIMEMFSERIKEISAAYPMQKDDDIKKQLTLEAIIKIDPDRKVQRLCELRDLLAGATAPGSITIQQEPVVPNNTVTLQNEHLVLVELYMQTVEATRQQVLAKEKSRFSSIPALSFLSSITTAATDFEMSYITNSPAILQKLYTVAAATDNMELQTLVSILIQHISPDSLKKAADKKDITAYLPYAYLINNTARLLVQAGALREDQVSFSLLSSFGIDKISKFLFQDGWKEKAEQFLDIVKNNFGIRDKNLDWVKAAAAVIGVVLVADAIAGSDSNDSNPGNNQTSGPVYFEDQMAAKGFSVPSSVQY